MYAQRSYVVFLSSAFGLSSVSFVFSTPFKMMFPFYIPPPTINTGSITFPPAPPLPPRPRLVSKPNPQLKANAGGPKVAPPDLTLH